MDEFAPDTDEHTEAYLRLLTQHDKWLTAYVFTLVPRSVDSDDILQEVKVTMWKHFSKFERGTNFRAWARRIALNQILNYRRSAKRSPLTELDETFIETVAAEIDRNASALDHRAEALRHCLMKLPESSRKIIVWRYFEDCGIEEIAAKSRRSVDAVYQLLSRVRGLLNNCVNQTLADPS